MTEIRKDYATPTWVVFSAARSQRPGAFRNPKDETPKENCPFCEGHEAMTPPEVLAYRVNGRPDGTGRRLLFAPALSDHRDPDRAPPDPRGDRRHACARGGSRR